MAKLLAFPGSPVPENIDDVEDEDGHVRDVLESFAEHSEEIETVVVVGVKHNGQICWGSSSGDLREILWLAKAMERISMDHSLGLASMDDYDA